MARRMLDKHSADYDLRFVFANTGQEHEKTLQFVDRCDREWGLNVVWLEAEVIDGKGNGTTYRVTDLANASRDGRPFEDVIRKYGVPNSTAPHCTRELKSQPIASYIRDNRDGRDFRIAIGIRSDEIDRIDVKAKKKKYIYPLISSFPTFKYDVKGFWSNQSFSLGLPEHLGNCLWCWKQSGRKHGILARSVPEIYDFPARMEREYGSVNSDRPRVFFRGNTSTEMLMRGEMKDFDKDDPNGCSESCEAFAFGDDDV
jgi:hypothetical protein